jgi:CRP/FNR family cyclic AMP-dependent transcriptional regulator
MPDVEYSRDQIFYRLPGSLCQLLYEAGEITTVPAGTAIVNEGDRLHQLFILLSGRIEILLLRGEHRLSDVKLTELGPGDCFGEYAFVDRQPASATIRASDDCEVYSIAHDTLEKFLDTHHSVASVIYKNLLRILVGRLRASNAELDLFTMSF